MAPSPSPPLQPEPDVSPVSEAHAKPSLPQPQSPATCPICSNALYEQRGELGALTLQGRRVERSLYHSGCITLMLAHSGAMLKVPGPNAKGTQEKCEISWGLSPVSRTPIDGFLKLPSIFDQRGWIDFVDWKGSGYIDIDDLAVVIAALLPIDEQDSLKYVQKRFHLSERSIISESDLSRQVFPVLELQCRDLCTGKRNPLYKASPFLDAIEGLRLLSDARHLYALRQVCTRCVQVVQAILIHRLCCLLSRVVGENRGHQPAFAIVEALGSLARKGDVETVRSLVMLLEHEDEHLRYAAVKHLPAIASGDDHFSFAIISTLLGHSSSQVRVDAIKLIACIAEQGHSQSLHSIRSKITDKDARVRVAAIKALGELALKGDQDVIREIVHQIVGGASRDSESQKVAEDTLPLVAKGDDRTIEIFCKDLMDEDEEVCLQALKVLGLISEKGDKRVVDALLCFCRPEKDAGMFSNIVGKERSFASRASTKAKRAAISSLGKVAERGDKLVLKSIIRPLLQCDDLEILEAGIRLVGAVGSKDDPYSFKVLSTLFNEKHCANIKCPPYRLQSLRLVALEMLQHLAIGGDDHISEFVITSLFKVNDLELRRRAAASVGTIAKQGDCRAIRALKELHSTDTEVQIRLAAKNSLEALGPPIFESDLRVCIKMCCCFTLAGLCAVCVGLFIVGSVNLMANFGMSFPASTLLSLLFLLGIGVLVRYRWRLSVQTASSRV